MLHSPPTSLHFLHAQNGVPIHEGVFSLSPLPSINQKAKIGQGRYFVAPAYRQRELEEIDTLTQQRIALDWNCTPEDRYAILYAFPFRTELRADLHNPIKPTCDLLGKGRWQWVKRQKVFIPHAQIIWDDNRVLVEMQFKVIEPDVTLHKVHLHVLKIAANDWTRIQILPLFQEIVARKEYSV